MKYFLCGYLFFLAKLVVAQPTLSFAPSFQQTPLSISETASMTEGPIQIETLQFYISQIELYQEDQLVYAEENSFHLLDISDPNSLQIPLHLPAEQSYTKVKFTLGLDSLTNVSGAMGGDLDPTKGMYWTWQSGYINFKLEGTAKGCPARNQAFQFHLGGYAHPYENWQEVELSTKAQETINIKLDIDQLFHQINIKETYQIMSPNQQAVELARLVAGIFSISE